jgi:hypothetical protein
MTTFTIPVTRVISEVLDGEAIIIDSMSGAYFTLDADGTAVWTKLQDGAIDAAGLAAGAGLAADRVQDVMAELVAAGLVTADGDAPAGRDGARSVLTKYTDMEELLLLDPIHDVDSAGWPVLPADDALPTDA